MSELTGPLLRAEAARIAVDDVPAIEPFDLRTVGRRLVLVGDAAPLVGVLTSVPLGLAAATARTIATGELPPVRGVARAVGGVLEVCGRDTRRGAHVAFVGAAPLDPPLPSDAQVVAWLTESARLGLARAGHVPPGPEIERRVAEALAVVGLGVSGGRPLRSLAVPERRALVLAHALVAGPEVVVAEHPLAELNGQAAGFVVAALEAVATACSLVVSVGRLDPVSVEGGFARRASDVALFAKGELALAGAPASLFDGARVYRISVRSNVEALTAALMERGARLTGGPTHFAVALPESLGPSDVLRAAASTRSAVVEIVPLM